MQTNQKESINTENYILELIKTVLPYKWSIAFITLIAILLAKFYLYFIPSTYQSSSIIKVKVNNQLQTQDFLRDSINNTSTVGIKQEVLSLQTFKINTKALDEVDFSVQYFQKKDYKPIELYNNAPLSLELTQKVNRDILHKEIILTAKDEGFTLSNKNTEKLEILTVYPFDMEVETPYFSGIVSKEKPITEPIYLILNGNNRNIYENIISKKLSVKQMDLEANLIQVSFQDNIPQRANAYVNALVKNYMKESLYKKDNTNNKVLSFLDLQLESLKVKLERSESELEKYKTLNSVEPDIKLKDSFEKLSTLDLDLSALALKEKLAKNLIIFVKNNRNLDAIGPTLLEFNDQATIKFIDNLETLQQKEDELSIEFTGQYPELINIRKRIKRIKNKILLNVKNLKSTLIAKRKSLEKQKNKYEKILKELPQKEKKLIHFKRDYEVNSKMYTYLLEKKSENELIKVATISDYEVIDHAYTPTEPVKPKRLIVLIIASIIGFFIAVIIALLRALLVDKVATKKEIKLMTKLPIYGIIPLYKNALFSTLKLKEAYHQLATNLQFSKKEDIGSIILFSSHSQGEGKTGTVVNVAGVFQNSGYKTIVIDFNMRAPSLHGHFGIEQQYSGISTYLSQRDNIGNIIYSTNFTNLDIIPAGPIPPNPSELVLSKRLSELFETLRQKYEYILIDTAAYDLALESLFLMQFSTINLIVIREKMSKKSTILDIERLIQEKNLQNMGLVLKSIVKEDKSKQHDLLPNNTINNQIKTAKPSPIQLQL
ncbi:MAG: Tyrosine-protein kinase EpsD [uncultured Sulfurovum sp.]|uniref:non-specific protein-tyrosine kinase n=1 Tax=uncultured Sulfurovum sp. TaxID=269237 RepID=A0A6S6UFS3_9BACT|nr:MAG: Tyrosine-protein kinase EpsD [uncultured Sulfurovum sp.]